MSKKLLPCPFCGGEALMRERYVAGVANTKHYRRECHHCKATFANWYRSMKKADEAWNRRALPENEPLTLEELREMDGKLVWVEVLEGGDKNPPYWAIVDTANGRRSRSVRLISYIDGDSGAYELYGETWLAYRTKPERSE